MGISLYKIKKFIYWRLSALVSKVELSNIKTEYHLPDDLHDNRLELLQLMQSLNMHIAKLDLIIDVGCNEGLFTKTLKMFKEFNNAVLFEPNEMLLPKIKKNTENIKNVFICNEALSNTIEELEYYYHQDPQMNSLIKSDTAVLSRDFWGDKEIDVKIIRTNTLDSAIDKIAINLNEFSDIFLKLDTQGNELNILRGGGNTLEKTKFCLVEYMVSSPYAANNNLNDLILFML